jgi:hypothetical protein
VNDDTGNGNQTYTNVAMDSEGKIIIIWTDTRNTDKDIYAQRYLKNGTKIGDNFRVTQIHIQQQFSPNVKLWNNRIYSCWVDNSADSLGDIWANVLDWSNPVGVGNTTGDENITEFALEQNYPNPFNPITTIVYSIPKPSYVNLVVYDIVGRVVKRLVSEFQQTGEYQIIFNAARLSSGIYFYRLQAGSFMFTRKMLLLQ